MLKIEPITPKILHVYADSQIELNEAFLRFSEHGESPYFKGKVFTFGQYRKWYAETNGAFTYLTDWTGFNIPDVNFKLFVEGMFDPLTPNERQIINWIKDRKDTFCVIGAQPDGDSLEHEICHALWHIEPEYKEECEKIILGMPRDQHQAMKKLVLEMGYTDAVINDEMHAYVSADRDWLEEEKAVSVDEEISEKLQEVKSRFYQKPE